MFFPLSSTVSQKLYIKDYEVNIQRTKKVTDGRAATTFP